MSSDDNADRPGTAAEENGARIRAKGRGALSRRNSRFDALSREPEPMEPAASGPAQTARRQLATTLSMQQARSILSQNQSPDLPFSTSINPYRGCEHGCIYCYARPTHAYLGLSPGLDFETRLYAKSNAVELFRTALSKPGYVPTPIALGANTDPYQPVEKQLQLTRGLLEVALEFKQPLTIITKSALVERDMDLLAALAERRLVHVFMSVASLDSRITRHLEPRATAPQRRIEALAALARLGIPTGTIVAPIIPAITDADLERILQAAAAVGVSQADYVVLRLPLEVRDLFKEWLQEHFPERAEHVMSLLRQFRGGKDNDSVFGRRLTGTGVFADLIKQRFRLACKRLHLNASRVELDLSQFRSAAMASRQLDLFED